MRGTSAVAYAAARDRLEALAPGADLAALGGQLFAVAGLLDATPVLRRALADPGRTAADKAALVRGLLAGRVDETVVEVLVTASAGRWSQVRDLGDAVEQLAVHAEVLAADQAGQLDDLEDELFRFGRLLAREPALRGVLADRAVPAEHRRRLLDDLVTDKVTPPGHRLLARAVTAPRGRGLEQALEVTAGVVAARRTRWTAVVASAVPLTEQQRERLAAALARAYGHEVHLQAEVVPGLLGGFRVRLGDEVLDASVLARLDAARRRLAG